MNNNAQKEGKKGGKSKGKKGDGKKGEEDPNMVMQIQGAQGYWLRGQQTVGYGEWKLTGGGIGGGMKHWKWLF